MKWRRRRAHSLSLFGHLDDANTKKNNSLAPSRPVRRTKNHKQKHKTIFHLPLMPPPFCLPYKLWFLFGDSACKTAQNYFIHRFRLTFSKKKKKLSFYYCTSCRKFANQHGQKYKLQAI